MSLHLPLTILIWSAALTTLSAAVMLTSAAIYFLVRIWRD